MVIPATRLGTELIRFLKFLQLLYIWSTVLTAGLSARHIRRSPFNRTHDLAVFLVVQVEFLN